MKRNQPLKCDVMLLTMMPARFIVLQCSGLHFFDGGETKSRCRFVLYASSDPIHVSWVLKVVIMRQLGECSLAGDTTIVASVLVEITTVTFKTNQLLTIPQVCVPPNSTLAGAQSSAEVLPLPSRTGWPAQGTRLPSHISYMNVSNQDVNYHVLFSNRIIVKIQ